MRWSVEMVTDEATRRDCDFFRQQTYRRYYTNTSEVHWEDQSPVPLSVDRRPPEWTIAAKLNTEIVGTCRVVLVNLPNRSAGQAESLRLFQWDPQILANLLNTSPIDLRLGEVGRFAVSGDVDSDFVKRLLFRQLHTLAKQLQLHGLLAIMPAVVRRSAQRSGLTFLPVPGASMILDDPEMLNYRKRFPDYFLNSSAARIPQLCYVSIDHM